MYEQLNQYFLVYTHVDYSVLFLPITRTIVRVKEKKNFTKTFYTFRDLAGLMIKKNHSVYIYIDPKKNVFFEIQYLTNFEFLLWLNLTLNLHIISII